MYLMPSRIDVLGRVLRQRHHQALGAPRDGAGEMKRRGGRRAAGQDEGLQRLQVAC